MDAKKISDAIRAQNKDHSEVKRDPRKEIVNSSLSLEKAQKLVTKAMGICNKWAPEIASQLVPSVIEIESNTALKNEYSDDVTTLTGIMSELSVAAQDPVIEPKLNHTLDGYRAALTEFLSVSDLTTDNGGKGLSVASPFPPPPNPNNNPLVWDPTNSFVGLPDYLNGDHIMGVSVQVLIKLGVAMQGVLALQDKGLSDLSDRVAFLNKVQAAYTEISDYYANGNPSPINTFPGPTQPGVQGGAIHDPIWAVDLIADAPGITGIYKPFLPTLGALLKQVGWWGGDGAGGTSPNDLTIVQAFSRMNQQAAQAALSIDSSTALFPAATSNTLTFYGTPDYFNPTGTPNGTNNFDGYLHLGSAGPANSSIKSVGAVNSTGSSVSQKETARLQSTQTNYNNVWGFVSSFIKDLSQSLQTIAQA